MQANENSTRRRDDVSTEARKLYITLRVAALLLWVPHTIASVYVAISTPDINTTTSLFHVLSLSSAVIALTYYMAVYKQCGDYLLIGSWLLGVFSDSIWTMAIVGNGSSSNNTNNNHNNHYYYSNSNSNINNNSAFQEVLPSSSSLLLSGMKNPTISTSLSTSPVQFRASAQQSDFHLLWIIVAMLHGAIGGLLCKLKDMDEDRYYPVHSIGERLYVVVPFCTGQWLAFLITNGWRGIIVENLTILLSLGMVGYCVISYKLLQEHTSLVRGDLIGFLMDLLTTSFGVVFAAVVFGSIFVTMLAVPFLKSLFSLNALVSSLGIVLEVIVYELY